MIIKRAYITLFLFFIVLTSFAGRKVIMLTKQGGVYTIPCSINGVKRSLIFDTGASSVTISMQLAELLYKSRKLKDTDIKGFGKSQVASGHIINNMGVVLNDVEISGLHLKNVDAVIIDGQDVPLLLGLSAIQKLGKVTLDGNKLIIESPIIDSSQIIELREDISYYIINERYDDAIRLLKRLEAQDELIENDLYSLAHCYFFTNDHNKTLMYCQQWMGLYKGTNTTNESRVCYYMAVAYKELKSHYEADKWFSQAIRLISIEAIENTSIEDANTLFYYYNQKGLNYLEGKAYDNCAECFDIAVQYRMRVLGYTVEDIFAGTAIDEKMGTLLYSISKLNAVYLNNEEKTDRYAVMAVLCGNQEAKKYCDHFNLNYQPISTNNHKK